MMLELHAIFRGKVQGVGFRWTVVECAETHRLTGTVENLSDGAVEVFAQGKKEDLEAFVAAIKKDPGLARIDSLFTEYKNTERRYDCFLIIH